MTCVRKKIVANDGTVSYVEYGMDEFEHDDFYRYGLGLKLYFDLLKQTVCLYDAA